ncbi:hypothetical protein IID20_04915 [Patescibacteria group bacterium]|nr:hypothetical protein [Patescibacteria group bacterium]
MIFYDLIHGYQPFDPKLKISGWVRRNLNDVFLPTSLSMKKGLISRGVQLQGWTIKSWLSADPEIKMSAEKVLRNLKIASQKKHIEIGMSAYAHPILPMISDDLIRAQIILDREIVEKYLGRATWFWPPEGAIDKRTLNIVHQVFPDLILLIPDKSLGYNNYSGPIKIRFANGDQKVIVFSTIFKNIFMNADNAHGKSKYKRRPRYLPRELIFSQVRKTVHSNQRFIELLGFLKGYGFQQSTALDNLVLMRDWENAGSRTGLRAIPVGSMGAKEMGVFLDSKDQIDFYLPSQFNWTQATVVPISKILPSSWEMASTLGDPFPWWQPNKQGRIWRERTELRRKKISYWHGLMNEFDLAFQKRVKQLGGIKKALRNQEFKNLCLETFPAVHSCLGWHYFVKRNWSNYRYAEQTLKNIVYPALEKMTIDKSLKI